jgi:ankyrin repeat protein
MADELPPELDDELLAFAARMFDLARSGDTAVLAAYVDAGLPVDLANAKGDSLLMLAAYYDHPETVQALLERGADTERINDRGQTALSAAVFRRSADGVEALLKAGADPTLGAPNAIDTARFFEYPDMTELLEGPAPGGAAKPPEET